MKASKISKEQSVKIIKTAGYLAVSAVLGYLITLTTEQPELFGVVLTGFINLVLVSVKQLLTPPEK